MLKALTTTSAALTVFVVQSCIVFTKGVCVPELVTLDAAVDTK